MDDVRWTRIREFPTYLISDRGEVFNRRTDSMMKVSPNSHGDAKIMLMNVNTGQRFTRSVRRLVAEHFLKKPNELCDQVMVLDGNGAHVWYDNLAWRPRWFVWKYAHQLKVDQPSHYHNLQIENVDTGATYFSIVEAGMTEGLLFKDIWRSTYDNSRIFPHGCRYRIR